MASLDIAEKRLPQDGRLALKLGDKMVDVRVSTLPTGPGERVVLRLLDKDSAQLDLAALGMRSARRVRRCRSRRRGCGPRRSTRGSFSNRRRRSNTSS